MYYLCDSKAIRQEMHTVQSRFLFVYKDFLCITFLRLYVKYVLFVYKDFKTNL